MSARPRGEARRRRAFAGAAWRWDRPRAGYGVCQRPRHPAAAHRRGTDGVEGTADGSGASGAPQDVTVNLGFLLAAAALGLMCGPIVGGVLSIVSLRAPFILAACVELLNMLFVKTLVSQSLTICL